MTVQLVPYEYFLKYLLVCRGIEPTRRILSEMRYPVPPVQDLEARWRSLSVDRPAALVLTDPGCVTWLEKNRIRSMMREESPALEAYKLAQSIRYRHVLEMLLICGLPYEEVQSNYKDVTGQDVSISVVRHFEHFFWNRELLTQADWKEFLVRPEMNNGKFVGFSDNYKNGHDLYRAHLGDGDFCLYKLGLRSQLSPEEMLDQIISLTYARILDTRTDHNSESNARKLQALWSVFDGVISRRGKSGEAHRRVLDDLHTITLQLKKNPHTDIRELISGGTVRSLPKPVAHVDVRDSD